MMSVEFHRAVFDGRLFIQRSIHVHHRGWRMFSLEHATYCTAFNAGALYPDGRTHVSAARFTGDSAQREFWHAVRSAVTAGT